MSSQKSFARGVTGTMLPRMALLFVFWLALTAGDAAFIPAGIVTATAAAWVSLQLLPQTPSHPSPAALASYLMRFFKQSALAGVDVAWRAFDPRLPLQPGLVVCPSHLPPGSLRDTFCMVASLQPGTLPVGSDQNGALLVHCLDTAQPVARLLGEDEHLFTQMLEGEGRDRG